MIYLAIAEVLELHDLALAQDDGTPGIRDMGALESAIAQPRMGFGGQELYASIPEKAAALGYSLICNHAFIDGNTRIGYLAMEAFLMSNGWEMQGDVDDQERVILALASGQMSRSEFTQWVEINIVPLDQ